MEIGDAVVREEEDDKQNRQARKKRGDRQRVSSVIIEKATVGDCDGIFFRAGRERGAKRGTEDSCLLLSLTRGIVCQGSG